MKEWVINHVEMDLLNLIISPQIKFIYNHFLQI